MCFFFPKINFKHFKEPLMYYGYLTLSTENFLQKLKILEIVACKQISTPYIKLWLKPNKGFFLRKGE
jgi:hypothetical protein